MRIKRTHAEVFIRMDCRIMDQRIHDLLEVLKEVTTFSIAEDECLG
jgi:hypothetical protein